MTIISGRVQKCGQSDGGKEICDPPQKIDGETLTAIIPLEQVAGTITVDGEQHDVLKVQLKMSSGAFSIGNIGLSDETKVEFNRQVQAYFANHEIIYLINQLDLTNIPTLQALRPRAFLFKPFESLSGNKMLQLFIMTDGGGSTPGYSQTFLNNVPEPLPQGYSSSMIVKSERIFREVLPQSLKNTGWVLEGVAPGTDRGAWTAKFNAAGVTATADLSRLNSATYGPGSTVQFTYWIPGGNDIQWSLAGTALSAQPNGQLSFAGSRSQSIQYMQRVTTTTTGVGCIINPESCITRTDTTLSTDISVGISAAMPLGVSGSGREQSIKVAMEGKGVVISSRLSGGGPSGSDDLEAQVNQQIQNQIPNQLKDKLSIQFDAVSVFALKNLLFPAESYISFSKCHIPGDLLLLGNFSSDN